ncbi:acyl-CoA thioesterase/BAAT N-terminal domain-containing protein [Planomonospora sp. ID91781]|uniref:acyl-CoA thioesterase/bile acid-CoA:amino acid N-acyltransferase family protein n=1 Tax=Planomonospora sp. ID91781 TaxID=2738135 RepID=UPI0018C39B73|nr:acyl-CoA thioester hydrolase/BAAT C-terminal domain-containing protein [Planomonospora sp. ID91781]MBG0826015.1 acyl-CoA thioesterase/BAAT N-terminal domain-containing protein [Planomonospora sp. ID91781]
MSRNDQQSPRIVVDPPEPTVDTPLRIRLTGLPPGGLVTVRARQHDPSGRRLAAHATYPADRRGEIDLSSQAPLSGTYDGADPMGLIWSMSDQDGTPGPRVPEPESLAPVTVTLTVEAGAETGGERLAETAFDRLRLPPAVRRTEVRDHGLVGTLFHPGEGGPWPGVILLGGSEGGLHELDAALMAGHGFAVLALAYFGVEHLPPELVDIPLEYFGTAVSFLQGLRQVRAEAIGVIGASRGGEAALLVAATFPQVSAVVCTVGSGVVTQGISFRPTLPETLENARPSWTREGEPLPFLPHTITPEFRRQIAEDEPVLLGPTFRPDLAGPDLLAAATIPVERIRGPILFLTAGDDHCWPSRELSGVAMARLDDPAYRHVHYPQAGHLIAPPPFTPTTALVVPGPGARFSMGGTPKANAAARADAWRQSLRFFAEHLSAEPVPTSV